MFISAQFGGMGLQSLALMSVSEFQASQSEVMTDLVKKKEGEGTKRLCLTHPAAFSISPVWWFE